jgi:DNA-binding CsgD family transcriptional regulator
VPRRHAVPDAEPEARSAQRGRDDVKRSSGRSGDERPAESCRDEPHRHSGEDGEENEAPERKAGRLDGRDDQGLRLLHCRPCRLGDLTEPPDLSPRQEAVLRLAADGLTTQEMAERLDLAPETIETHVRNAMAKLSADSRTHAVATALRRALIR